MLFLATSIHETVDVILLEFFPLFALGFDRGFCRLE